MNISHFFELLLCLTWLLWRDILKVKCKKHMKISESTLYHKSHFPESYYQHKIRKLGIAKISFFSYKMFFEKIEHLYLSNAPQYHSASISLWYNYSFLYNILPIHSKASIGVLDKWMFWIFLETPVHQHFGKNSRSKYFWQLPSKTSILESFLNTLGSFSKSCPEQLFCREPASVKKNCTAFIISGIFRNFKNIQG